MCVYVFKSVRVCLHCARVLVFESTRERKEIVPFVLVTLTNFRSIKYRKCCFFFILKEGKFNKLILC